MKQITYILIFLTSFCFAQDKKWNDSIASEVNTQIWEPFKASYSSGDAETFNSLHTEDVMRITDSGIQIGEDYKRSNTNWLTKSNRTSREIDFRFEHRIYSGDNGYEVGYYKISYAQADGSSRHHYARFSVVLRKVDGVWKIAQDWDTSNINGHQVTAADFERLD